MKTLCCLILIFVTTLMIAQDKTECGDGTTYVNTKQAKQAAPLKLLTGIPQIESLPIFKSTDEEQTFTNFVNQNLIVKHDSESIVFRLNILFVVKCDGTVSDIKNLGDPKLAGLTNYVEVLKQSSGMWQPAEKDAEAVDCIYVLRQTIIRR